MISLGILFSILLIHWIADFILQSDKQAKQKATDPYQLTMHIYVYTLCWIPFAALTMNGWVNYTLFLFITFTAHWITDYFTSKLNKKLFASGNTHNLFVSIGFDQILHYTQLVLTYYFLA